MAARASVATMANRSGAVAGINGDFFDIGRTDAPPSGRDEEPSAQGGCAQGRQADGTGVPGAEIDYVFAVGADRVGDRPPVSGGSGDRAPRDGVQPQFAIGGTSVLVDSSLVAGLDDRSRAPRSAVGMSRDGRHLSLLTLDGRQADSVGATLAELASLLQEMGLDDAVNLDGGGSSTLVNRAPGAPEVAVVNDPSDPSARLVPNGIGVYAG